MRKIQANRISRNKLPTLQKLRPFLIVFPVMLLISSNAVHTMAGDFNTTFINYLTGVCVNGLFQGSNLGQLCADIDNVSGPVGSISSPMSPDIAGVRIEQRLQSFRESKEEQLENESRRAYAMNTNERFVHGDALQLPPAGGTSPDIIFGLGSGASVFFSAGAYALNHYNNRFEDGYEAQLPTVTVGADYRVNDWLLAGLAFNYTNYDGTYDDGGGLFSVRSSTRRFCRLKAPSPTSSSAMPDRKIATIAWQAHRVKTLLLLFLSAIRLRTTVRTSTPPASSPAMISRSTT
jgi:hypothetical protein